MCSTNLEAVRNVERDIRALTKRLCQVSGASRKVRFERYGRTNRRLSREPSVATLTIKHQLWNGIETYHNRGASPAAAKPSSSTRLLPPVPVGDSA